MDDIIKQTFGWDIQECKKLDGYDNLNYLITTKNDRYVFKTYGQCGDTLDLVTAENEVLLFLAEHSKNTFPKPIPFKDTSFVKLVSINGKPKICRMLSFLDGKFLGDVIHTPKLFQSLGTFLAQLNLKLQSFKSHTIKGRQWEWDIQYLDFNKKYINDIPDAKNRHIVWYFFQQFEEHVRPIATQLRKQIIHNDANEWNLLIKKEDVSGIIDFGDLAHSFLINELAIAITYACYDKGNPLDWAVIILKSYHEQLPLKEEEIKVLYYLIAARLCISVCNSAHAKKTDPDNSYASVSEQSAWKMLYRWLEIGPINAENRFRKAIGISIEKTVYIGDVMAKRQQYISTIVSTSYKMPIHMVTSAFQYMYDANGNTFLDAYNNIPHVGHSHPKVVNAGQRQMAQLNTNTRYLYDGLAEYAEKLLAKFPSSLNKVFFVNSGSAASDLAMRMAKFHTASEHIMVMEAGYHGNTQSSIDISDYKFNNPKGQGQKGHIIKTKIPDTYKGTYTSKDENPGMLYAQEAVEQIKNSKVPISAFICEPIVGCAGQVPLAEGYLKHIYPAIRAQGGVCISDEVQTGFGRLGDYFWGYESQEVIPDMVILGKPIANGHPMGAVVCTDEIARSFEKGVEFFSSFGGNPVSCAIASAVLEVIEEEDLQHNAKVVGNYYKSLLEDLMKKYPSIGDVRGSGLFLGIEMTKENSKSPDPYLASHIKNELRNKHILISTDGAFDNIIKTKPALCFSKQNAKTVVDAIDTVLEDYYESL
jgi:4-aminobutyrate aminotransferase-like enzyme/Ser/Thr protein kinase RdoA (MazF antagonist)